MNHNSESPSLLLTAVTVATAMVSLLYNVTHDAVVAVRFSGIAIIAISSAVIIGYAFDVEKIYTWPPDHTPMALPTAVLFLIVGMGKMVLCSRLKKIEEEFARIRRK